jgi:uncharacterized protein YoxC
MNSLAAAALVVLAVVSILWTVLLVAVLLELRRVSWRVQEFVRTMELELRPVLQQARADLQSVAKAAQDVADGTARLRGAMTALGDAGENIRVTTEVIRAVFGSRLIPVAGVLAGLRAGLRSLWRGYRRRRESS